jgi:hypothetical protein
MQFREIIALYCENNMKHINTFCGQITKLFTVKAGGTCSSLCVLIMQFSSDSINIII